MTGNAGNAEMHNHERRFLTFVREMYQEAQRLELKGPYRIECTDINGKELFQTNVLGVEEGTIVNLEQPWKEVKNFEVIEISLRYEDDKVMGPHIIDFTKDENTSTAPASGKTSEPATRKAAGAAR